MPARHVGGGGHRGQFREHLLQEVAPAQSPIRRVRIGQDKRRGRQERYWRWKEQTACAKAQRQDGACYGTECTVEKHHMNFSF